MCHSDRSLYFPEPGDYEVEQFEGLTYRQYAAASSGSSGRVAIITDIYGCNDFYQGFATFLAERDWTVTLVDLFSDLGELPQATREAAFERRHKLRDREVCDRIEAFLRAREIDAVVGFCLGGNYVFELARRGVDARLVAFYPFPAGLQNQDALTPPFEYMETLRRRVTVLAGDADDSAGRDNTARMAALAADVPALDVRLYRDSGHGFLAQLDSDDEHLKNNAEDALKVCLQAIEG